VERCSIGGAGEEDGMKFAVYCGSNFGSTPAFRDGAEQLGRVLAELKATVIFGGTNKGLMKVVADSALASGGDVHGVITQTLVDKGQQHPDLTISEVFATRALRKARMAELADGFIAMPGGAGTMEELFEIWVDSQFEGHKKPIGLYNIEGFFDHLLLFVNTMVKRGFLPDRQKEMLIVESDPHVLLARMRNFTPISVSKWM
jgi:uncharacterized protein (TIGR00730 family)